MKYTVTPEDILREWRKLQEIKSSYDGFFDGMFGKPKHERHKDQYVYLQALCVRNQDSLIELLVSRKLSDVDAHRLMFFPCDGSVRRETNSHWHGFMSRLRSRRAELPAEIVGTLDWLERVHGW